MSGHSPYVQCADDGRSVYRVTKTQNSGPIAITEYDKHARKVFTKTSQYGGQGAQQPLWAQQAFYYDAFGRNYATSVPYRPGQMQCWDYKQYDALNRVTAEYSAASESQCTTGAPPSPGGTPPFGYGVATTMTYDGLTTHVNANGHTSIVVKSVMGKVASKTLPAGGSESYTYDAAGNMLSDKDAAGVTEKFYYDPAGHRTKRTSPTSGTWLYDYDAKGELHQQSDPTGNVITQGYDVAGHLVQRVVTNGDTGVSHTVQWHYGTSSDGCLAIFTCGRLASLGNGKSGEDAFAKKYIYDAAGDVVDLTTTIGITSYPLDKTYDDYGRLIEVQYPPSPAPAGADLPPVARADASPTQLTSAGMVTLNGSASSDPDGGPERLNYQWSVAEKPPGANVQINGAQNPIAHVTLSENGNYQFKLMVGDGYKSDTAVTATVTVAIPPGGAGTPTVSPKPSATGNYKVSWAAASHATGYQLQEKAGTHSWGQVYFGSNLYWNASGKANGTYRYRVRSHNSTGYSAWSGVATETVNQTPGAPTDLHRVLSVRLPGKPYTVAWTAPSYGAPTVYKFESSPNGSFNPVYTQNVSGTSIQETFGNNGAQHYYRVRACRGNYCGGWSNTLEVTDPKSGGGLNCPPLCPGPRSMSAPGTTSTWRYTLHYVYDDSQGGNGALAMVYSADDQTHPYWTLTSVDVTGAVSGADVNGTAIAVTHVTDRATGRVTRLQASGWGDTVMDERYTYDVYGNRKSRIAGVDGAVETYGYDNDNRLRQATVQYGSQSFTTLTASYDLAGNFQNRGGSGGSLGYSYQSGNADRLASVSGAIMGGFSYDGAGRIISGPDGLSATYNARGLATVLHKSNHSAELIYAPDGHRYESILDGTTTEYYLAGGAFRLLQKGGVTTYREAVVVGGVTVAQLTTRSNATTSFHYFFHDALGSIVAITGAAGSEPIQRLAYGPYGRMRSVSDWSSLLGPSAIESLNLPTRRGYTGGEALTALGLVHLGARIYDPALGRWLSPDPAGASTPYVYVHDNPLSDTDTNGQMSLGQIVTIAALVALSVVSMGALSPLLGMYLAAMVVGAGMGFISGMIASNGNLHAGLMGALAGAVTGVTFAYLGSLSYAGGMFEKAAVEGFAGGALSSVEGGSFKDGFIGSFVGSISEGLTKEIPGDNTLSHTEQVAVASALGGTAARLTGGNFANGAITAAFQHLFNSVAHAEANPSHKEVNNELVALSKKTGIPLRALKALVATESSYRQFDSNGKPLTSKTGAVGITQLLKSTVELYGGDFTKASRNWKYNLRLGAKIYKWGYDHPYNSGITDPRIRAARAYDFYHGSPTMPYAEYIQQFSSTPGLLGNRWEKLYLSNY